MVYSIGAFFQKDLVMELEQATLDIETRITNAVMWVWEEIDAGNKLLLNTICNYYERFNRQIKLAVSSITALFVLPLLVKISDDDLANIQRQGDEEIAKLNEDGQRQAKAVTFATLDAKVLQGCSIELTEVQNPEWRTILYFPGNQEIWQQQVRFLGKLQALARCNLYTYNYRGTGASTGFPANEQALVDDGVDLVKKLIAKGTAANKIVLCGRSLGGTLSVLVAASLADEGIWVHLAPLVAPRSVKAIAGALFSSLSGFVVKFLSGIDWGMDAEAALVKLRGSIVYMHSEKDPLVTPGLGLAQAIRATPHLRSAVEIKMNEEEFGREFPELKDDPEINAHMRPYTQNELKQLTDAIKQIWNRRE